jgi:hypothetical protein
MPLLEAGIGFLLTRNSVRSFRRRTLVPLGLSARVREDPSSVRRPARSAGALCFARSRLSPSREPRSGARRRQPEAACERAVNSLANGP